MRFLLRALQIFFGTLLAAGLLALGQPPGVLAPAHGLVLSPPR